MGHRPEALHSTAPLWPGFSLKDPFSGAKLSRCHISGEHPILQREPPAASTLLLQQYPSHVPCIWEPGAQPRTVLVESCRTAPTAIPPRGDDHSHGCQPLLAPGPLYAPPDLIPTAPNETGMATPHTTDVKTAPKKPRDHTTWLGQLRCTNPAPPAPAGCSGLGLS